MSVQMRVRCLKLNLIAMIDRVLNFGPNQTESYYFQLIPLSLTLVNKASEVPPPGTTYNFSIRKGAQKFDQNRIPVEAAFTLSNGLHVLPITTCRLNFYIPSHNKQRKTQFSLKMIQNENKVDYEIGEYSIDVNAIIDQFKDKNQAVNRHEIKTNFSEDYELDFEIYVDTNRVNLEKNIRDKKFDRASKSPLRTRKEGDEQTSARKNLVEEPKPQAPIARTRKQAEEQPSARKNLAEEAKPQPTPKVEKPSRDVQEVQPPVEEQTTVVTPAFDPPSENIEKAESRHSNPKPTSVKRQPSARNEKAETGSVQSKGHVPIVQTKFKQLSKLDTPAEVKMTDSQRLAQGGVVEPEVVVVSQGDQSKQEKIFLWVFMIIGTLLIYWAMHPSSRV